MIAIVLESSDELVTISTRIHTHLKTDSSLTYNATSYGYPFKHPNQETYALEIVSDQPYYDSIMSILTEVEQGYIETLSTDWFE